MKQPSVFFLIRTKWSTRKQSVWPFKFSWVCNFIIFMFYFRLRKSFWIFVLVLVLSYNQLHTFLTFFTNLSLALEMFESLSFCCRRHMPRDIIGLLCSLWARWCAFHYRFSLHLWFCKTEARRSSFSFQFHCTVNTCLFQYFRFEVYPYIK